MAIERSPLDALADALDGHPQRRSIERSVVRLLEIARNSSDADEWRLITGALADIRDGFNVFAPHRQTRKVTVFGSARTTSEEAPYPLAEELAREAARCGFEIMTGAGGGVMEAANRGAGCENSIGLNVDLPFEQHANRYVNACDGRLLHFRYFFTRKLFFLRESDALVVMPGGFGTFDELFESLTLIQTGRTPPIPVVLLAPEGDDFWSDWLATIDNTLLGRALISAEDTSLLKQASSAAEALGHISHFYRVFHTAQFAEEQMELLMHSPLPAETVAELNQRFDALVDEGSISQGESCDHHGILRPCLRFHLDRRRVGLLYQLIDVLNGLPIEVPPSIEQPGQRVCSLPPTP
ncbi:TIGR00730 family Rossman fold protein [Synechococcus sp. A10-1-5-1]|uniref:LOG family protein n=1 Tax=Synechococcus sp. A10-1-5-1 TaxID=2936507 RepID=UPI0020019437|nr:TIGR00730 family Rossman fold protein [Synechococcus sp. A10-1-5-1]UPM51023.1 TIGR00730 family Rossman fold protein [Synechococcus sp. A10-1-5-1]